MHDLTIFSIVAGGLILAMLTWLGFRVGATINHKQKKRCGKIVMGFYLFVAAFFLMSLGLTFVGSCFVVNDLPGDLLLPWMPRAIVGGFQAAEGVAGLLMASSVLRRDPCPVNWRMEFSRLKAGLQHQLGMSTRSSKS